MTPSQQLSDKVYASGMTLIFTTFYELKVPDKSVSAIWHGLLKWIPDEIFMKVCLAISMTEKRPPQNIVATIIEYAQEMMGKVSWNQAYQEIGKLFEIYYWPDFSVASWEIIQEKLRDKEMPGLIPLAEQFGKEILYGGNPSATRAQFRDMFNLENIQNQRKALNEPKSIKELLANFKQIKKT